MTREEGERLATLDALRGVAVMGILLMNIVGFALPDAAYLNPDALGPSPVDRIIWTAQFVLVDGKMRGLFALLFGIGILLAADAADRRGADPAVGHLRRMAALLLLGLLHFYGFWTGDILTDYAVVGLLVFLLRPAPPLILIMAALAMFAGALMTEAAFIADLTQIRNAAVRPGADADADARALWALYNSWIGWPTPADRGREVAMHMVGWSDAFAARIRDYGASGLFGDAGAKLEVAGFMLMGMAIHKAGLLSHPRAARIGALAAAIGLPGTLILAWICWQHRFDPVDTAAVVFAWSIAPRVLLTLAWLFLLAGWAARALDPVSARVRAAGRMALSNYLGATLVFTALFDGWGLGLYGQLGRPVLLLLVLVAWAVMLWWSPAWLSRFRLGPVEWLWRSMAAMQLLPLTRK